MLLIPSPTEPNTNGYNISTTLGYFKEDMEFNKWWGMISVNFSLNYQWKTGNRSFISAGIMRGLYGHEKSSCDAYSGCHDAIRFGRLYSRNSLSPS